MKKILLIEDNEDIRNNTAEILELSSYEVEVAENGKVGVEKALANTPDLIICDIMMPVLDGYGVLHAVHRNEKIKNVPFIFLTAKTERNDFRKGMELGADDYITKPFSGTELLNAVEGRLKKIDLLKKEISSGLAGLDHLMQTSFGRNALDSLTADRHTNRYRNKTTVYSEGNHPHSLFYVLKGKVKAFRTNDQGKELITDIFSPGDFLGYVPLMQGAVYKDTAKVMEDTELAVIPKEDFTELLNSSREISQKFISLLANNVEEKENQLLSLAYNSLRKKVADALLLLVNKYNQAEEPAPSINIARENLATITGTATESVIRTLSDFRSEKLIDIKENNIVLLNKKKLENLVN